MNGKNSANSVSQTVDRIFDLELRITEAYKKNLDKPVAIREAETLKASFDGYFAPIRRGDLLAGRVHYPAVGISPENTTGGLITYCKAERMRKEMAESGCSDEYKAKVEEMIAFWQDGHTFADDEHWPSYGVMTDSLDAETLEATTNTISDMTGRMAGSIINYDKLIALGVPGLRAEIEHYKLECLKTDVGAKFHGGSEESAYLYDGMLMMLDNFCDVCLRYAEQARNEAKALETKASEESDTNVVPAPVAPAATSDLSDDHSLIYGDQGANGTSALKDAITRDNEAKHFTGSIYADGSINVGTHIDLFEDDRAWHDELLEMAQTLENITKQKPQNMREGLQLAWLYTLAAMSSNYGRMDVYIGDLYAQDIDNGTISEQKALELVQAFWRLTVCRRICARETAEFNARVVIGGKNRRNPENADRFCMVAMEASRTVVETEPQLTLRVYDGMNKDVMKKALDVIGEGRVYPMLYNDDVNIPAVASAFDVSEEEAASYYPYGCGEYVLENRSIGSPNCSLNLLKVLEIVLHNGVDIMTGKRIGFAYDDDAKFDPAKQFDTFEKLWKAYAKQTEYYAYHLGKRHAVEYTVEAKLVSFSLISLLYDGCLKKGRSIVDRGTIYTGSIIESFGIVNTADSLTAIKELVYDRKVCTLNDVVAACDADFDGYEALFKQMRRAPKYGNDIDVADDMVNRVSNHLADYCKNTAGELGLDYFLIVNINNWFNVEYGKRTLASAEGRRNGGSLANGSTPTAGNDNSGMTAMLNSLAKINPDNHAGYSHNMKFSKAMFTKHRPMLEALLSTYWKKGGTQAMITAVNKDDLQRAMVEPEKYTNLIVRVGGFSARFIELKPEIQLDLINRTMHEV